MSEQSYTDKAIEFVQGQVDAAHPDNIDVVDPSSWGTDYESGAAVIAAGVIADAVTQAPATWDSLSDSERQEAKSQETQLSNQEW